MEPDVPFFSTQYFMPQGHCYLWSPAVLWLNVLPDLLIALAYFTIPFILIRIARRRRDLPFNSLFICFGIFIVSCGLTHVMDVWNVWNVEYWLEGLIKLITAAASVPTAILLWRAWPHIMQLPSQNQLREANDSLARANREMEAFTASVSHDLRSPLSTIAGQAGMLELSLANSVTEDQRSRLTRIQASVKKMSELIEALLALSRISRHTLQREILDVSALAQEIVGELRHASPQRSVDVTIQPGMTAHGDQRLISDMLTNLIDNAWKFTSKTADARIEIGEQTPGNLATFFVRDNGAGFDMAYEQKLFKPFQRLHGTNEFEGSGIGLATVQRIIERHGGRIWADAKPNQGARFCFTLPTRPLSDARDAARM
ncbi:sensor histidine kinase [Povalibacter sp.]|uniref:sensor histidine kinase n=1 Tax=Povalibacter sp. TaxID=1962978 RepID=UPI002F3E9323